MHIEEVTENSTRYLDITFKDETGALSAPTAVKYRVDCITTGTAVKPLTTVNAPTSTLRIILKKSETAIITNTNSQELKRVSVIAEYGTGDEENDEYDFYVKNLKYIT